MKTVGALIILVSILIIPVFASATETLLAREERALHKSDNPAVLLQGLIDTAMKKAKDHACIVKAQEKGVEIHAKIRYSIKENGIAFAEIISDECENQIENK